MQKACTQLTSGIRKQSRQSNSRQTKRKGQGRKGKAREKRRIGPVAIAPPVSSPSFLRIPVEVIGDRIRIDGHAVRNGIQQLFTHHLEGRVARKFKLKQGAQTQGRQRKPNDRQTTETTRRGRQGRSSADELGMVRRTEKKHVCDTGKI